MADQMGQAMDDQMADVVIKRLAVVGRLAGNRLPCQNDIAEKWRPAPVVAHHAGWEGQDVGRLVLAAPGCIQVADRGIVREQKRQLAGLAPGARLGEERGDGFFRKRAQCRLVGPGARGPLQLDLDMWCHG